MATTFPALWKKIRLDGYLHPNRLQALRQAAMSVIGQPTQT
ncbi:hypothetical protein CFBP1590__5412 [Pseudomonas viridiflava]|uniref:Uncharacterized protein n=1 Tax=Pseudomonas viridiflava TaxID=33069 RepID=A0A1Y6JSR6_PSEVI|nr:hypothetical protein [Pseudomonas viridiflava]SMS12998.1 hypothetical protein CFBP1590__5412 [Pseudomonas viridiflava]VVN87219.1 hypothetical protein PS689_01593 [Pseudomonas fluorescens]